MSIQVKEVSKLYGDQKALDTISFEIKSGEIVGFLGPNGAGKSTMMKIITTFIPPSSGEVYVNGLSVTEEDDKVRKIIGYLPENNPLYADMYVKEYLNFVAGLYSLGKNKEARVKEMLHQVGLEPEQHKKIGALSKGYKQRVGLAQALIHDPKVLILDEPTSGLDPNQIVEIRNLISTIGKEKTVMLSTHIMQEVEAICHRIIIIKNGKIVADNTPEQITRNSSNKQITLHIEFDREPNQHLLSQLKGVIKLKQLKPGIYLIQATESPDIRPLIFDFAVEHQLKVLSQQLIQKSLEEAFQELTR
jgi:ABC-2 type transport system ATP-binding protein